MSGGQSTGSNYAQAKHYDQNKSAVQQLAESVRDGPIEPSPFHSQDRRYGSAETNEAPVHFTIPPVLSLQQQQGILSQFPPAYSQDPLSSLPQIPYIPHRRPSLAADIPYAPRSKHIRNPFEIKVSTEGGATSFGGMGRGRSSQPWVKNN